MSKVFKNNQEKYYDKVLSIIFEDAYVSLGDKLFEINKICKEYYEEEKKILQERNILDPSLYDYDYDLTEEEYQDVRPE